MRRRRTHGGRTGGSTGGHAHTAYHSSCPKIEIRQFRQRNCKVKMPAQKIKLRSIAVGMSLAGKSARVISRVLHVPKSTVRPIFWLSKFQASNDVEDDACSGRPKATSSRADRRLIRLCKANRFVSSSMLLGEWGEDVSARTVRNRLNVAGLHSRRPVQKPKLSPCHVSTRLAWAMARCHF